MKLKLLFVMMLMLAAAGFTLQNATVVTVRFMFWQFTLSQALLILLAVISGTLAGLVVGTFAARGGPAATPPPARRNDPS